MSARYRRVAMGFALSCCTTLSAACGQEALDARSATASSHDPIIDGVPSRINDYPATGVLLFSTHPEDGPQRASMFCTGTLIAPDTVMAAAHCNMELFMGHSRPVTYYFSLAPDVSAFGVTTFDLPEHTYEVASMVSHPDFNIRKIKLGLNKTRDLGLFFLREPVTEIEPARVIRPHEAKQLKVGTDVEIVGYGRRSEVETPGVDDSGIKYQGTSTIRRIGSHEIQIGKESPEPRKCHGDSGGPTYMMVKEGARHVLTMVGITSHAYDRQECAHGGVDTRIDPLLSWVRDAMDDNCNTEFRPACPEGAGRALPL